MTGGGAEACRCALCGNCRTVFYCGNCVQRGDFTHSAVATPERFADKQLKLMKAKVMCDEYKDKYDNSPNFKAYSMRDNIIVDVNKCKNQIEVIKMAIRQKKDKIIKRRQALESLEDCNAQMLAKVPVLKNWISVVSSSSEDKAAIVKKTEAELDTTLHNLFLIRKKRLDQLVKNVFPIKILVDLSWEQGSDGCTEQAIAEALQPATVSDGSENLAPIRILSAILPVGGDYSAYCNWVKQSSNKTSMASTSSPTNTELISKNLAFRFSAILAYSTQLVLNIAYYLDIRLPYSVNYNDFCSSGIEERKFKNLVKKLHICAATVINQINVRNLREIYGQKIHEPPLHVLLRLCPIQPLFHNQEDSEFTCEDSFTNITSDKYWWESVDKECLQMTSDDEEPVCLNWEPENNVPLEMTVNTMPKGFSESIRNFFNMWK